MRRLKIGEELIASCLVSQHLLALAVVEGILLKDLEAKPAYQNEQIRSVSSACDQVIALVGILSRDIASTKDALNRTHNSFLKVRSNVSAYEKEG